MNTFCKNMLFLIAAQMQMHCYSNNDIGTNYQWLVAPAKRFWMLNTCAKKYLKERIAWLCRACIYSYVNFNGECRAIFDVKGENENNECELAIYDS